MVDIIPAPLDTNREELLSHLRLLSPLFTAIQVDIADGVFVPNATPSVQEVLAAVIETSIPGTARYDVHLMVREYEKNLDLLQALSHYLPLRHVFLHASLMIPPVVFERSARRLSSPFRLGLVLNPEDEVGEVSRRYDLDLFPVIQIMTVHPGFQGQAFIPESLQKIDQLRNAGFGGHIFLDGGINDTSLPRVMEHVYRPNAVCVGSYLTRTQDVTGHLKKLSAIIRE